MDSKESTETEKVALPTDKKLQIRELQLKEAIARANLAQAKLEHVTAANELKLNFPANLDPNTLEFK